jgi:SulP family sulfate permease
MSRKSFLESFSGEFKPSSLLVNLLAGVIIGVLIIIVEVSFAALIFSGDLAAYVFQGIGLMLFGSAAIAIVVALTSSYPATIARPHEIPAAVLAIVAGGIATQLSGAPETVVFTTVVGAVVLTSVLTGIFFLVLGFFKLGTLVRFVPYPVVGGFLAGTGWLLVKGGLNVMTDLKLEPVTLGRFTDTGIFAKWLAGLCFALLMLAVSRRFKHFLVMPALMIFGCLGFYLILLVSGSGVTAARQEGWLLGPFQQGSLWRPLTLGMLLDVQWSVVFGYAANLGTILLISAIPLLLNESGLELVVRRDIDFNRELKSAGAANIVAALGGGTVGLHSLSLCALGFRMGAGGRLVGVTAGAMCAASLGFGSDLLTFLPKPVLGGLLLYSGLNFLIEWLVESYKRLPRADYLLVAFITVVIGAFGFLQGVGVGVLIAVVLFVIKYSRVNVVKFAVSGAHYHSNVDRGPEQLKVLTENGDRIYVLKMQGFIFFGTANDLLQLVRSRAENKSLPPLRYVVLDFHLVNGLDSSAVSSFAKLKQVAADHRFSLVFTDLTSIITRQLESGGFMEHDKEPLRVFQDLDHGLEWCEDRILEEKGVSVSRAHTLSEHLAPILPPNIDVSFVARYFEREETQPGQVLLQQGEVVDCLYFIESGRVTVVLEGKGRRRVRLRTMDAGTVVGEIGMYTGTPATASVVAAEKTVMYGLRASSLATMEREDPDVAAAFHKFIARLLAARLTKTNQSLQAMME